MVSFQTQLDAVLTTLLRIPKFGTLQNRPPVSESYGEPRPEHLLETYNPQTTG